jgi:signal transduction histidine kinase
VQGEQWLRVAAIGTWLACGLQPLVDIASGRAAGWPVALWAAAFVLFGAALSLVLFRSFPFPAPWSFVGSAALQTALGLTINFITSRHFSGPGVSSALLVIVAAELPYLVRPAVAWVWIAVQTAVLVATPAGEVRATLLFSLALAFGGFQAFAVASSLLTKRETEAREQLAIAHTDLLATRALLAESSRADERLRIARDLHDTLGHHLTALSLQLDVASRLTEGRAAQHVEQAHAITRLLLADVRDVVSSLRETTHTDLAVTLRELAAAHPGLQVDLELPPSLVVGDAARAEALLRCVQEVITNGLRHGDARHLWIRLDLQDGAITLHARDDGRGAAAFCAGHGLTGMRERFERLGGRVEFVSTAGEGFAVHAFLPPAPPT